MIIIICGGTLLRLHTYINFTYKIMWPSKDDDDDDDDVGGDENADDKSKAL